MLQRFSKYNDLCVGPIRTLFWSVYRTVWWLMVGDGRAISQILSISSQQMVDCHIKLEKLRLTDSGQGASTVISGVNWIVMVVTGSLCMFVWYLKPFRESIGKLYRCRVQMFSWGCSLALCRFTSSDHPGASVQHVDGAWFHWVGWAVLMHGNDSK